MATPKTIPFSATARAIATQWLKEDFCYENSL